MYIPIINIYTDIYPKNCFKDQTTSSFIWKSGKLKTKAEQKHGSHQH